MEYLLLIYSDESQRAEMTPEEMEVGLKGWFDYTDWLREKGWHRAGEALTPTASATTIRALRRDQGAARRLLPGRLRESR